MGWYFTPASHCLPLVGSKGVVPRAGEVVPACGWNEVE
ncbi:Uncharacterised protein [Bordetella pertussis]|nr:Uncharacterised protein [Bordetella pertussis]